MSESKSELCCLLVLLAMVIGLGVVISVLCESKANLAEQVYVLTNEKAVLQSTLERERAEAKATLDDVFKKYAKVEEYYLGVIGEWMDKAQALGRELKQLKVNYDKDVDELLQKNCNLANRLTALNDEKVIEKRDSDDQLTRLYAVMCRILEEETSQKERYQTAYLNLMYAPKEIPGFIRWADGWVSVPNQ